jgi:hypothetical protein
MTYSFMFQLKVTKQILINKNLEEKSRREFLKLLKT